MTTAYKSLALLATATLLSFSFATAAQAGKAKDSDHDGLPNSYEMAHGLNPNSSKDGKRDNDRDNLNNLKEFKNGTDPLDADSDDDGLVDGKEVNKYKTSPLEADSDDDGLADSDEVKSDSDPNDDDSDEDGVKDGEDDDYLYGVIVSFDDASGTLTVTKADGSTITGIVTEDTEIEYSDDVREDDSTDDSSDDGDDEGETEMRSSDDDADTTALVAGAEVKDLDFEKNSTELEEIKLYR